MTKKQFLKILDENQHLIENYAFTEFYEKLWNTNKHYFTELFLDCGVNPLEYMNGIPEGFAYESKIESIEIPGNITSISDSAFSHCDNLTTIKIPNSVTSIGSFAFASCTSLTSIEIPNSVTSIDSDAFSNCISLTSIEIPSSITNINISAFAGCKSLTSIVISNTITHIGDWAFYGCNNLTDIYYQGSQEDWAKINIEDGNGMLNITKIHYNSI